MSADQEFFGRGAVLELLKKRVLDLKDGYRQNVALVGNRCVGKSTILHNFIANLADEDVTVVYVDLENRDMNFFLRRFTSALLSHYSQSQGLPLHEDINLLLESTQKTIPHTVQVIRKIYKDFSNGKLVTSFMGLLAIPEIFTNETGRSCVLILDEFQGLGDFGIPDVFQHLGQKIMTQKKCLYLVSSSYPQIARQILSEKLSLLFGNFEVVRVEPFDPATSQEFIGAQLKDIKITAALRNFLIDFTGGHPLYLHLICRELVNLSVFHKQSEIFIPLLTQAMENTLFHRWGVISRHFELIMQELGHAKGIRLMPSVLISLSNGKHKIDELSKDLSAGKAPMTSQINRLMDAGIVVKNGHFHYFKDKLFRYWVKYIFQERLKGLELDFEKQKRQFQEELHSLVENFKAASCKDLSSRIVELLSCFDNEAFDLNGRRYKLPLFQEIVPWKMKGEGGSDVNVIRALTSDNSWLIVFKDDPFAEADVNAVLEESRKTGKTGHGPQKRLIISLNKLDANTRVRALQEKFWIWSEEEVNTLLTLFDKPYIVR